MEQTTTYQQCPPLLKFSGMQDFQGKHRVQKFNLTHGQKQAKPGRQIKTDKSMQKKVRRAEQKAYVQE